MYLLASVAFTTGNFSKFQNVVTVSRPIDRRKVLRRSYDEKVPTNERKSKSDRASFQFRILQSKEHSKEGEKYSCTSREQEKNTDKETDNHDRRDHGKEIERWQDRGMDKEVAKDQDRDKGYSQHDRDRTRNHRYDNDPRNKRYSTERGTRPVMVLPYQYSQVR